MTNHLHTDPAMRPSPAPRPCPARRRAARAGRAGRAGRVAVIARWLRIALRRAWERARRDAFTDYLMQAQDLADLERRQRAWENGHPGRHR